MRQSFLSITIPLALIPILLLAYWRLRLKRLKSYPSSFGKIEVFKKYNGEKLLAINTYPQGVSIEQESIKKSYWFAIAQQIVKFCKGKKEPQVLMLGLGANTIPNLIAQQNPKIYQTLVEINYSIIQACQNFFNLNNLPNYQLIQADAFELVKQRGAFKNKFDVIIVDIYIGKPPFVDLKSLEPSFIENLLPHLKPEGMIIFNKPGHTKEARSDSQILKKYLTTLFSKTQLFDINDPRGYKNNLVLGIRKIVKR
ncbi:MAG: methyltransferase domain-containing protein [Candidatus Daviesbacteria bacterium]